MFKYIKSETNHAHSDDAAQPAPVFAAAAYRLSPSVRSTFLIHYGKYRPGGSLVILLLLHFYP
jgi:hypothetical protein